MKGTTLDENVIRSEEVVQLLERLVARSIVSYHEESGRYKLLDTIREYAREQLHSDPLDADIVQARHFDYYHELAVEADEHWASDSQHVWYARVLNEVENTRVALDYAYANDRNNEGVQLYARIANYLNLAGMEQEVQTRVREALAKGDFAEMPYEHTLLLRSINARLVLEGKFDEAIKGQEAAVAEAQRCGRIPFLAMQQRHMGNIFLTRGNLDQALVWYLRSRHTLRESTDAAELAPIENNLGVLASMKEEHKEAVEHFERCVHLYRKGSRLIQLSLPLANCAQSLVALGEIRRATNMLLEAIALLEEVPNLVALAEALDAVALIAVANQDPMFAAKIFGSVVSIRQQHRLEVVGGHSTYIYKWKQRAAALIGKESFSEQQNVGKAIASEEALQLAKAYLLKSAGETT